MIKLPEEDIPQTVEQQLSAAVYAASDSRYPQLTRIERGGYVCYIVSERLLEQHAPSLLTDFAVE